MSWRSRPDGRHFPIRNSEPPKQEEEEILECSRCGISMPKRQVYGTFDGRPVCKPCYDELEKEESGETTTTDTQEQTDEEIDMMGAENRSEENPF